MNNLDVESMHTMDYPDNKMILLTVYKKHRIYIKQVFYSNKMNWFIGYVELFQTDKPYPLVKKYLESSDPEIDLYSLPINKEVTSISDLEIDAKRVSSLFLGFDTAEPFERNTSVQEFTKELKSIVDSNF